MVFFLVLRERQWLFCTARIYVLLLPKPSFYRRCDKSGLRLGMCLPQDSGQLPENWNYVDGAANRVFCQKGTPDRGPGLLHSACGLGKRQPPNQAARVIFHLVFCPPHFKNLSGVVRWQLCDGIRFALYWWSGWIGKLWWDHWYPWIVVIKILAGDALLLPKVICWKLFESAGRLFTPPL